MALDQSVLSELLAVSQSTERLDPIRDSVRLEFTVGQALG
jgi:hypothetical protein